MHDMHIIKKMATLSRLNEEVVKRELASSREPRLPRMCLQFSHFSTVDPAARK
jgi:hypothetical protein